MEWLWQSVSQIKYFSLREEVFIVMNVPSEILAEPRKKTNLSSLDRCLLLLVVHSFHLFHITALLG